MLVKTITWIAFVILFCSCTKPDSVTKTRVTSIDPLVESQTAALFQNLKNLEGNHTLFGHQATLAYGYYWRDEENRSDVKDVTGDYPALYGWDLGDFHTGGQSSEVTRNKMKRIEGFVRQGFERGGVISFAWHMSNPVTGKSFYDTTAAVSQILPGGSHHQTLKNWLDTAAVFFKAVAPIPIIFRPWHEHNGDWFWWCKASTSEQEFIQLWRFTVDYLMKEKKVHNLLYAFSPDRSRMNLNDPNAYFYGYPGDEYVDIIGLDNYWDVGHPANFAKPDENARSFAQSLEVIGRIASEKNKVAALTETGMEAIPNPNWWTDVMLKGLEANEFTKRVTYIQVWRNATKEVEKRDHYYAPFKGQVSEKNFIDFVNTERMLLEKELPDLYKTVQK
jgi:mannan endo-1,4-beta-mannosidase